MKCRILKKNQKRDYNADLQCGDLEAALQLIVELVVQPVVPHRHPGRGSVHGTELEGIYIIVVP